MGLLVALIILAIVAAVLGFGGIVQAAMIAFWVLLALLIIWLIVRLATGRWLWG